MGASLNKTFDYLSKTENEAALEVLIAGLDASHQPTQHLALRTLMDRRDPQGHREVFRRLPKLDEHCRAIVSERPERLKNVVGETVRNADGKSCASACNAIVAFRLYEVLPALVSVLSNEENPNTDLVAHTVLKLTESFYRELSGIDDQPARKNQENLRIRITGALEDAVKKYHRHERKEIVEALLLLAKSKSVVLRRLLQRPEERSHHAIVESLSYSPRGGVTRLLLAFLEDPQMPLVVAKVICGRCDAKFVGHLARTVGSHPTKTVVETLERFDSIAWALPGHEVFGKLDDAAQEGAVQIVVNSSMDRALALKVIGYLLMEAKPAGRRAAAKALGQFEGPEANTLVIKGLNDEDPQVRANLLVQVRSRRIPGALSLMIRMVDSRDEEVHRALREAMPEFTFCHFLANLDNMPENLIATAGHVVSKIDRECKSKLEAEMTGPSPVRRRRAVQAAVATGLADDLEQTIILLLSDEDHVVRVAAAKSLADCKTLPTWEALRDALLDRSFVVKEAAEKSLQRISQSLLEVVEDEEADAEGQEQPEVVAS
ncbi:MAG TPA: HEAT repeat domain-containing protein [Thermoguttaceae bacterium]|nr:HEAT repeat domain-containing protein [Thermoguttaceae bacterium]